MEEEEGKDSEINEGERGGIRMRERWERKKREKERIKEE